MSARQRPYFSVIVPTFDGGRFLHDALDSVARQTYASWECVIVDDGSRDESPAIGRAWAARHRAAWLGPPAPTRRGNVAAARNRAVRAARGKWMAFLDQDDVWHPEKLEAQRAYLASHPDVDAVGCWPAIDYAGVPRSPFVEQWAALIRHVSEVESGAVPFRHFVAGCLFCLSGVVARRSALLEEGGFDPALALTSDWMMWTRLAARRPLGCVRAALVTYRLHARNELQRFWREDAGSLRTLRDFHAGLTDWLCERQGLSRVKAERLLKQQYWESAYIWADGLAAGEVVS